MFHLNSTLNFEIPPVLVFQLEVYYKVDRLLKLVLLLSKKEQLLDGIQIKHLYINIYTEPLRATISNFIQLKASMVLFKQVSA